MNFDYVSIDRIYSKFIRDISDEFSESDIIEWCAEALEFIGAIKYYEEAVAYIEVSNHQCRIPAGLHNIIQIARNNLWCGPKDDKLCPRVISESKCNTSKDSDCNCNSNTIPDYIILDCNGQPLNDYNIAYYRPYFDLQYEYFNWRNSSMYRNNYSPVRLATHSFFNNLVCSTDDDNPNNIYNASNGSDEYTVIRKSVLRFSFKEGSIALAYRRQVTDPETGYPLIPDHVSYTTAITKYITMMMFTKEFYKSRDGAAQKMQKAEADWQWYCKQAGNAAMMPYGEDEHQNLLDQRSYMLPNNQSYFKFFGNMATPEDRVWNDPDGRNRKLRSFVGN